MFATASARAIRVRRQKTKRPEVYETSGRQEASRSHRFTQ